MIFNFLNFFCNFLGIPYSGSGKNSSEWFFFFSPFVSLSQPILAWKEAIMVFFYFFAIFLEFSIPGQVKTHRNNFFFSFILGNFQPILAWKETIMVFFNFLNFFAIFLEFSITLWVGTKRNDNFYFLSISTFSDLFWLEMKP